MTDYSLETVGGGDHEVGFLRDSKYSHLWQPQCSCGWRLSSFSKLPLPIAEAHVRLERRP